MKYRWPAGKFYSRIVVDWCTSHTGASDVWQRMCEIIASHKFPRSIRQRHLALTRAYNYAIREHKCKDGEFLNDDASMELTIFKTAIELNLIDHLQ